MDTLTFLFTDIEGSTALFEKAGVAYKQALNLHFHILRAAFTRHDGREFKNTGDGLLAAFEHSASALACAIEIQNAFARTHWPDEVGALRVRMGLHRGEVTPGENDFQGLPMHFASRILDAAHGRQILCSADFASDLPAAMRADLRDLGLYRLRGIPTPARLFQIDPDPRNPEEFPALRTPPAFAHRLPSPATRFFGREKELAELAQILAPPKPGETGRRHGQLITLHGPGGVGKTRLSLAVAERLLTAYSHAVWFIPLAELRDGALLPEVLREALALPIEAEGSTLLRIADFLGAQPSLLILDNFEQLVPAGVETVRVLLEKLPSLAVIAPSRVRLGLSAEYEFNVGPLLLPPLDADPVDLRRHPSVQLYCDRARQVRRDFQLTPENAADVAKICRTLEGLPLAIELAAARATVLSPRQILGKLERRLDFLTGGKQDFGRRHQTLRAAVAWSHELLTAELQGVFAQLAIFRSGWTLEAAEAVLSLDATAPIGVVEALAELQACSLITAEPQGETMRFRMYEAIREFAAECALPPGQERELRERFHAYFGQLCRGEKDHASAGWHHRLIPEVDNLRAMLSGTGRIEERLRAAVCLYPFWMSRGTLREGRDWLRRLSAEAGEDHPATSAAAANAAAILAWKAGDMIEAQRAFERALAYWETQKNEANIAGLLNNLGILAVDRKDFAEAHDFYRRSLEVYRRQSAPEKLAAVLSNLAENALRLGDLESAGEALRESERLLRAGGDLTLLANTLHNLAEWHLRKGATLQARQTLAECLALRARLDSQDYLAATWATLAAIALAENLPEHAVLCVASATHAHHDKEEQPDAETLAALQHCLDQARAALPEKALIQLTDRLVPGSPDQMLRSTGEWREIVSAAGCSHDLAANP